MLYLAQKATLNTGSSLAEIVTSITPKRSITIKCYYKSMRLIGQCLLKIQKYVACRNR